MTTTNSHYTFLSHPQGKAASFNLMVNTSRHSGEVVDDFMKLTKKKDLINLTGGSSQLDTATARRKKLPSIFSLTIGLPPNFPYNVFALINHNGS